MTAALTMTPANGRYRVTMGRAKASSGISRQGGLGFGGGAYDAGGYGTQELAGWSPRLTSADSEVSGSRDLIVARGRHLYRNSGWAQGGVEKRVDAVVGSRIWLKARPDFAALGMSAEWADEWSIRTESLFRLWANSPRFLCDVERHQHFGGLVRMAYQHYVLDGEATAPLYFLDRGGMFSTSVMVMDPDRLGNPDGRPDNRYLRAGVALDANGAAMGYWVRDAHQGDINAGWDASKFTFIPRETVTGRTSFVHVFDKKRAHMRRGLGRFTAVMGRMKMLDRYDSTELQAAITNAVFGLYAKTNRDSEGMRESMAPAGDDYETNVALDSARADFYEQADLTFEGVRVAVMPTGDEIDTIQANRGGSNFAAFQRTVLNSIAAALGLSGEQLSNDWSGINYSSARTLLNEIWRGLNSDRHLFTQSFCTPIYAAWLEEAVARGLVDVPGGRNNFYVVRDALTQCDWIGPGRGFVDPKKEAEAAQIRMELGISALPFEAAEQGADWRVNLYDNKRVKEERAKYGLDEPASSTRGDAGGGNDANAGTSQDTSDNAESGVGAVA